MKVAIISFFLLFAVVASQDREDPATRQPPTTVKGGDAPATRQPPTTVKGGDAPATRQPPTTVNGGDAPATRQPPTTAKGGDAPATRQPPTTAKGGDAPATRKPPTTVDGGDAPATRKPPTTAKGGDAPATRQPPTTAKGGDVRATRKPPTTVDGGDAPATRKPPTTAKGGDAPATRQPPTTAKGGDAPATRKPPTTVDGGDAPATRKPPTTVKGGDAPATRRPPTTAKGGDAPATRKPQTTVNERDAPATRKPPTTDGSNNTTRIANYVTNAVAKALKVSDATRAERFEGLWAIMEKASFEMKSIFRLLDGLMSYIPKDKIKDLSVEDLCELSKIKEVKQSDILAKAIGKKALVLLKNRATMDEVCNALLCLVNRLDEADLKDLPKAAVKKCASAECSDDSKCSKLDSTAKKLLKELNAEDIDDTSIGVINKNLHHLTESLLKKIPANKLCPKLKCTKCGMKESVAKALAVKCKDSIPTANSITSNQLSKWYCLLKGLPMGYLETLATVLTREMKPLVADALLEGRKADIFKKSVVAGIMRDGFNKDSFCSVTLVSALKSDHLQRISAELICECPDIVIKGVAEMKKADAKKIGPALMKKVEVAAINGCSLKKLGYLRDADELSRSSLSNILNADVSSCQAPADTDDRYDGKCSKAAAMAIMKKLTSECGNPEVTVDGKWLPMVIYCAGLNAGLTKQVMSTLESPLIEAVSGAISDAIANGQIGFSSGMFKTLADRFLKEQGPVPDVLTSTMIDQLKGVILYVDLSIFDSVDKDSVVLIMKQFAELFEQLPVKRVKLIVDFIMKNMDTPFTVENMNVLKDAIVHFPIDHPTKKLTPEVAKQTKEMLGSIKNMKVSLASYILGLLDINYANVVGDGIDHSITGDGINSLVGLNNLLKGISIENLKLIPKTAIKEAFDLGVLGKIEDFTTEHIRVIFGAIRESPATTKRRRREVTTDMSTKTGNEIIAMGNMLVGLTSGEILTITTTAFDEAVETIGQIEGFTMIQKQAFITVAKQTWGAVQTFTPSEMQYLGMLILGLTSDEIKMLDFALEDTIASVSIYEDYTPEQRLAGWDRTKELHGQVSTMPGSLINSLNYFALAMTPTEISLMNIEAFRSSSTQLGLMTVWSVQQLSKLSELAVIAYGAPNTWDQSRVSGLGSIVAGSTVDQLSSISPEVFSVISPEVIAIIPPESFSALSAEQFAEFGEDQLQLVSNEQIDSLPDNLQTTLENLGAGSNNNNDGQSCWGCDNSAGITVHGGVQTLMITVTVTMTILFGSFLI